MLSAEPTENAKLVVVIIQVVNCQLSDLQLKLKQVACDKQGGDQKAGGVKYLSWINEQSSGADENLLS